MSKTNLKTLQSLSVKCLTEGNLRKAFKTIKLAIKSEKNSPLSYYILGRIQDELLQFYESIKSYKKYLALDIENKGSEFHKKAKINLSLAYLTIRDFEKGTQFYKNRHSQHSISLFKGKKEWCPNLPHGKVFIWAEQGIGDEILFIRFIKFLEPMDFEFYLECDKRLHNIVKNNFPFLNLLEREKTHNLMKYDYHIAIGDLLSIFHSRMEEISHPYLNSNKSLEIDKIFHAFPNSKNFVGISWRSLSEMYHSERSYVLEDLCKSLNKNEDVLVVLQPSVMEEEILKLRSLGFTVIGKFDCLNDIDAVFSLISKCNKVISIANSVVHFAGALGINTTLLLPKIPSWRWGVNKDRSDLYPSIEYKTL